MPDMVIDGQVYELKTLKLEITNPAVRILPKVSLEKGSFEISGTLHTTFENQAMLYELMVGRQRQKQQIWQRFYPWLIRAAIFISAVLAASILFTSRAN
jgi:hypothetical protein